MMGRMMGGESIFGGGGDPFETMGAQSGGGSSMVMTSFSSSTGMGGPVQ